MPPRKEPHTLRKAPLGDGALAIIRMYMYSRIGCSELYCWSYEWSYHRGWYWLVFSPSFHWSYKEEEEDGSKNWGSRPAAVPRGP